MTCSMRRPLVGGSFPNKILHNQFLLKRSSRSFFSLLPPPPTPFHLPIFSTSSHSIAASFRDRTKSFESKSFTSSTLYSVTSLLSSKDLSRRWITTTTVTPSPPSSSPTTQTTSTLPTPSSPSPSSSLSSLLPPFYTAAGFVARCPPPLQPYLRLIRFDKPIGTWLVFLPSAWSIAMASPAGAFPNPVTFATFALGALIMRGAGCTINDLWDKDIDSKVARTKDRPIASGALSPKKAFAFFAAQMAAGACILFSLNNYSILMGFPAVGILITYPLMKRFTNWPQAYLGLAMNYGIILGWTAITGSLDPAVVLPLYGSAVMWTLIYDTIYAHQDKEDDVLVGVKSTALFFGDKTKEWLSFFALSTVGLLYLSGYNAGLAWPFYIVAVGMGGLHLLWQLFTLNINDSLNCLKRFKASKWFGIFVLVGVLLGNLFATPSVS